LIEAKGGIAQQRSPRCFSGGNLNCGGFMGFWTCDQPLAAKSEISAQSGHGEEDQKSKGNSYY
jgi:hypothetical protein